MADFSAYFPQLLKHEGGYTVDTGGRTMYGITEAVFKDFQKKTGKFPGVDIAKISQEMARAVYSALYWAPLMADKITNQGAAVALFDFAVNAGIGRAVKEAQAALNSMGYKLAVDGGMGPATLAAINKAGAGFANALTRRRVDFYKRLAASNPEKYGKYLKGWLKRAETFFSDAAPKAGAGLAALLALGVALKLALKAKGGASAGND